MQQPQTFAELLTAARTIYTNGHTFQDWKDWKDYLLNNTEHAKAIISKETIPSLSRFTYHKDKKNRMVDSVLSNITQSIVLSDSFMYSPTEETHGAALKRITDSYTEENYLNYKEQLIKKREEKEKALNNPETLQEFREFISRKGEAALTDDQRIKYDELTADSRKAAKQREEEKQAQVKQVENVTAEMEIKESFHAKKQIPLFVVVLSSRVEKEVYQELNNRAKKLNGYYSSYKGQGAIPGFTFEKREEAELFAQVKNGDVNAAEIKQEAKEEKQQTRAEALREKGQKMEAEGNEELTRDRKDNTHRRVAQAAHAEAAASAKVKFGKELQKIAAAMETGEIKYLDKLSNGKDLEQLKQILSQAKTRHINAEKLNRDQYQISLKTANFCELPYPVIYNNSKGDIMRMTETAGKKLAAARMLKRLQGVESYKVQGTAALEDYETLFCKPCAVIDRWRIDRYKEQLMELKRVKRIGIDSIEELRAAIRELITLTTGAGITDEQKKAQELKALERQFIGAKIPGFFPTPETLAAEVVRLAGIKSGETVLEPSAGLGHLAQEINSAYPENELQTIEINYRLAEVLQKKGLSVHNGDFLEHTEKYDKIIMNPPFENLQDVDHVLHAFNNCLKDGGRIVAIMANNKQRKPEFLQFVEQYGYFEENPAGSFISAFNSTGVSTITVVIDKPEGYKTSKEGELEELPKIAGFNTDTQTFEALPEVTQATMF